MNLEQENKNHFRNIAIEQLIWQLKLVEESTLPNKAKSRRDIIQNFLDEYKNNELVNLNTIEEVEEELKKVKIRNKKEKRTEGEER